MAAEPDRPAPARPATPIASATSAVPAPGRLAVPSPRRFQHPRADRQLLLDGHEVGYAFRRARRRSIGFVVSAEGLSVSAPRWVAMTEVDAALRAKAGWILRKLHDQQERASRLEQARVTWEEGARLPFLGRTIEIRIDPAVAGVVLAETGGPHPIAGGLCPDRSPDTASGVMTLQVGLPRNAGPERLREAVQGWLQRQALCLFQARCDDFAQRLKVTVRRVSLSSATTRWGSASVDGSIRLNWRLVHFGLPVIDYVVAHELSHLREMNHSPAFWEVVRSVIPDVEARRGQLKSQLLPVLDGD